MTDKHDDEMLPLFQMSPNKEEDSSLKELRNLISKEDIDVRTVLTEHQIIHLQRIFNTHELMNTENDKDAKNAAKLIEAFALRFMALAINNKGISREQYIKAMQVGHELVEKTEANPFKKMFGVT